MSVCTRGALRCQTNGCRHPAVGLCKYPVKRNGRTTTCNRHICQRCSSRDGYCPPHARIAADSLVLICPRCFTQSCPDPACDYQCEKPGAAMKVTEARYRNLISFGIL